MDAKHLVLVAMIGSAVTACGGGGGGGSGGGGGMSAGPGTPMVFRFEADHLDQVGAPAAHARGVTGEGVTIAIFDSGVRGSHQEFAGRLGPGFDATFDDEDPGNPNTINGNPLEASNDPYADASGHGTHVAGIALGANVGVAPGATLASYRLGDPIGIDNIKQALDHALARDDIAVINMSFGLSLGGNSPDDPERQRMITGITEQDWIFVNAAGNDDGDGVTGGGRYVDDPDFQGQVLIVGAVNANNEIAGYSSQAHATDDQWGEIIGVVEHFIVAPGQNCSAVGAPGADPHTCTLADPDTADNSYGNRRGTSFAAPVVTGAIALVRSLWPAMDGADVVDLLLETATDLGDPGFDSVYGAGLLNIEAALQPVGDPGAPAGGSTGARRARIAGSSLTYSRAFGDALAGTGAKLDTVMALDAYDRDFYYDLSATVGAHQRPLFDAGLALNRLTGGPANEMVLPGLRIAARYGGSYRGRDYGMVSLTREAVGLSYTLMQFSGRDYLPAGLDKLGVDAALLAPNALLDPALALADAGTRAALDVGLGGGWHFGASADTQHARAGIGANVDSATAVVGYRGVGLAVEASLGSIEERGSVFGTRGDGALSLAEGVETLVVGLTGRIDLTPRLALLGAWYHGEADLDQTASLFGTARGVTVDSAALGLHARLPRGHYAGAMVSQPLAVSGGSLPLNVPVGRVADLVVREVSRIGLAPEHRETDIELYYGLRFGPTGRAQVNLLRRVNPGHFGGAPAETVGTVSLSLNFN